MSYISANSNPEALHIWGEDGVVNVSIGSSPAWRLPKSSFNGLIRKFNKNYGNGFELYSDEELTYRGAKLFHLKHGNNFQVCLGYVGKVDGKMVEWKCFMWEVTWMYLAMTNAHR